VTVIDAETGVDLGRLQALTARGSLRGGVPMTWMLSPDDPSTDFNRVMQ
jgi:hypothetical protein